MSRLNSVRDDARSRSAQFQQSINIIPRANRENRQSFGLVINVIREPKLRCGDFYFVAVRQAVQCVLGDARRLQPFFRKRLLEPAFYALIQSRPFHFCKRVDRELIAHLA